MLSTTFARIHKDPRQQNIQQFYFASTKNRLFPRWQMGLLNLNNVAELDRQRLQALMDRLKGSPDGATIVGLLRDFREHLPVGGVICQKAA